MRLTWCGDESRGRGFKSQGDWLSLQMWGCRSSGATLEQNWSGETFKFLRILTIFDNLQIDIINDQRDSIERE